MSIFDTLNKKVAAAGLAAASLFGAAQASNPLPLGFVGTVGDETSTEFQQVGGQAETHSAIPESVKEQIAAELNGSAPDTAALTEAIADLRAGIEDIVVYDQFIQRGNDINDLDRGELLQTATTITEGLDGLDVIRQNPKAAAELRDFISIAGNLDITSTGNFDIDQAVSRALQNVASTFDKTGIAIY